MRAPVRLLLFLDLAAVGAAVGALVVAIGVPLGARGALTPGRLALVVALAALGGVALGLLLLGRSVARPVDRILDAAERLRGGDGELPLLQPPGEAPGHGLQRAAIAFERLAGALAEERVRLAAKVAELQRSNTQLADARESLLLTEKLATVGRLAAGVAHEVGNPLGAIGGYADLARARLAAAGGDETAIDYLERIRVETGRIDRIVRELLDFARPAPLALVPVALGGAVDAALRLAAVQRRFHEVRVVVELPAELPRVRADEGRLAQLVLNLLLNAGDAMGGRGAVRIAARVEGGVGGVGGSGGAGGEVIVTVADDGPGIPAQDLGRLFDPFFTTKPPGEGTGLGLAVCHGIAASFGGAISAANRVGGGAVFTLRLPVA